LLRNGPTFWLNTTITSGYIGFYVPTNVTLNNVNQTGTIELYFSGGGNYQCLDLAFSTATPAPPTPAPPTTQPPVQNRCCLYFVPGGKTETLCTEQISCPYISSWTSAGTWLVDNCKDCGVVSDAPEFPAQNGPKVFQKTRGEKH